MRNHQSHMHIDKFTTPLEFTFFIQLINIPFLVCTAIIIYKYMVNFEKNEHCFLNIAHLASENQTENFMGKV